MLLWAVKSKTVARFAKSKWFPNTSSQSTGLTVGPGSRGLLPITSPGDFAIGYFTEPDDVAKSAGEIIKDDWQWAMNSRDQPRWAYLFGTGLIDEEAAEKMADEVWGNEEI